MHPLVGDQHVRPAALLAGMAFFGAISLRQRLFTRWNAVPLLAGIFWPAAMLASLVYRALVGNDLALPEAAVAMVFMITFGGLAFTGYRLQADTPRAA